jgi:hypothetical protein
MLRGMPKVGAPLRGVRGRTDVIGSENLPGLSKISLRTDATQSRPYPMQLCRDAVPTLPKQATRN